MRRPKVVSCWQRRPLLCGSGLFKFGAGLLFHSVIIILWPPALGQPSQCVLSNGKCTYHVDLSLGCSNSGIYTNRIQNDYDERVNDIEKSLTDVKVDHARRITDLENTINTILGGVDRANIPGLSENVNIHNLHKSRHNHHQHGSTFEESPERQENELLNALHSEFSSLRGELSHTKKRLRDTERSLKDTRLKLNKTQDMLIDTTQKLLRTERHLSEVRDENERLQEELTEKEQDLNITKTRLTEALKELRKKEIELFNTNYDNDKLRKEIEDYKAMLAELRSELENALRKYHELNVRHDASVVELNGTREELATCYRGKTSMFCGFEDEEICGFTQDNDTDFFDWERHRRRTPSANTGPKSDHTCRNKKGYYMYAEASSKGSGQNARIISPKYAGVDEQCVEFFYHMFGRHVGTLNVYTLVPGQNVVPLWRAYGNQGDVWISARIHIPADVAQRTYQVVFEAITEKGYQGDIAIDDFRVFDGPCVVVMTAVDYNKQQGQTNTTVTPISSPP